MSGYPATANASAFFPVYNVVGFAQTINGATGAILGNSASGAGYFSAYKACNIYMMSFCINCVNSVAATATLQPYGALIAGGTPALLGASKVVSVPASGPFVSYSQAQNINLPVGSFLGIFVTSSVTNANLWINATLWATQAAV